VSSFHFPKDYQMRSLIKHLHRDERGATATEYALLVVFVALAIAVGASTLGQGLSGLFSKIGTTLSNAGITLPPLP
jgi:pilus assembly protein Flp/PilA